MDAHSGKRIAKNTLLLYIRMAVTMVVQLYTSRIVLEVLGIDDYGIWNLVATLVVSITFITNPLTSAIQRFLNFAIGKDNDEKIQSVFSQSIILFLIFALVLTILLESVGVWLLNHKLNIPTGKIGAANIVFQLSIASFIATLIRLPYDSMIIAYEKFNFYAYISILDVVLKLAIVYLLKAVTTIPHLVFYSLLTFAVSTLIALIYKIYCNKEYKTSHFKFKLDKSILKEIASFSGWSFLGAFAVMMTNQGVNIVLNLFFGVVLNAAMGITNQVGNAVNHFVSNFQVAFQPQIVKTYALEEYQHLKNLIYKTTKFSFLLIFMIAFPLTCNMNTILHIWLGNDVPEFTPQLCSWLLLSILIESISAPLWMTIQATGKIRTYQIIISSLFLLNIVLSYIFLSIGYNAITVMYVRFSVSILCFVTRLLMVHKHIKIHFSNYFNKVILPALSIALISGIPTILFMHTATISNEIFQVLASTLIFIIILTVASYYIAMDRGERNSIKKIIFRLSNK